MEAAIIGGSMLGSSLLGGGGGGGYSPVATMRPGQENLLDQLTKLLGGQIGQGITPYGGERVPPISPLQQQGFGIMGGMMPMAGEGQTALQQAFQQFQPGQAQQMMGMGSEALQGVLADFDPTSAREYWQTSFVDPAMQTWSQDIIPGIKEHYAARGAADSGAMTRAIARSGERMGTGLSAQLGDILFRSEEAQKGRQLQGIPEAYRMGMMPGDILGQAISGPGQLPGQLATQAIGAGGIERGIGGEQLGAAQQQWGEAQPYQNPWLSYLGTALGTESFAQAQQGPGMAALMAPMFGQMLGSDWFGNMLNPAGSNVRVPYGGWQNPYGT